MIGIFSFNIKDDQYEGYSQAGIVTEISGVLLLYKTHQLLYSKMTFSHCSNLNKIPNTIKLSEIHNTTKSRHSLKWGCGSPADVYV